MYRPASSSPLVAPLDLCVVVPRHLRFTCCSFALVLLGWCHGLPVGKATTKGGRTAVHLASLKDHAEVVQFLLKHGADPEATDDENRTPLFLACDALSKVRMTCQGAEGGMGGWRAMPAVPCPCSACNAVVVAETACMSRDCVVLHAPHVAAVASRSLVADLCHYCHHHRHRHRRDYCRLNMSVCLPPCVPACVPAYLVPCAVHHCRVLCGVCAFATRCCCA